MPPHGGGGRESNGAGEDAAGTLLLDALRKASDDDAALILAHIRLGYDLKSIAQGIASNQLDGIPMQHGSATGSRSDNLQMNETNPGQRVSPSNPKNDRSGDAHRERPVGATFRLQTHHFLQPLFDPQIFATGSVPSKSNEWPLRSFGGQSQGDKSRPSQETGIIFKHPVSRFPYETSLPGQDIQAYKEYPQAIQQGQLQSLFVPAWAVNSHNGIDGGPYYSAVSKAMSVEIWSFIEVQQRRLFSVNDEGTYRTVLGSGPQMGALFDTDAFIRASEVSKWAARFAHSFKMSTPDFTQLGLMHIFYTLMAWMIHPTPERYEAVPPFMRPTPYQLFTHHPVLHDFILWPALRDVICQDRQIQEHMSWATEVCASVRCKWDHEAVDALSLNANTGDYDLTTSAKECISDGSNWCVGEAIRAVLRRADAYVNIG